MTEPTPVHGCTIGGQPAMPILVAEYNQLVTRVAEAEQRLRNIAAGGPRADAVQAEIGEMIAQTHDLRDQLATRDAALARVRVECDRIETMGNGTDIEADSIRRAIAHTIRNALEPTSPATTQPATPAIRQLQDDRARLAATLAAVLGLYPPHLNADGPAVRPRHVPAELVERWRGILATTGKAGAEAPATPGPLVDRPFRTHRQQP